MNIDIILDIIRKIKPRHRRGYRYFHPCYLVLLFFTISNYLEKGGKKK